MGVNQKKISSSMFLLVLFLFSSVCLNGCVSMAGSSFVPLLRRQRQFVCFSLPHVSIFCSQYLVLSVLSCGKNYSSSGRQDPPKET